MAEDEGSGIEQRVDLDKFAALIDQPRSALVAMARKGEFPPLLKLSERKYSVEVAAVRRWMASREISAATEKFNDDFLRGIGRKDPRATPKTDRPKRTAARARQNGTGDTDEGRAAGVENRHHQDANPRGVDAG